MKIYKFLLLKLFFPQSFVIYTGIDTYPIKQLQLFPFESRSRNQIIVKYNIAAKITEYHITLKFLFIMSLKSTITRYNKEISDLVG